MIVRGLQRSSYVVEIWTFVSNAFDAINDDNGDNDNDSNDNKSTRRAQTSANAKI